MMITKLKVHDSDSDDYGDDYDTDDKQVDTNGIKE